MTKNKKVHSEAPKLHSSLGASSAYRWMECPASVRFLAENPIKNRDSAFADEGTAAHELSEMILNSVLGKSTNPYWDFNELLGKKLGPKRDIEVTKEMMENVMIYIDEIAEEESTSDYKEVFIESKIDLSFIHPEMFGTNDAIIVRPYDKITVYDLKYGAGVPVEVENNAQMMYYALGAAHKFKNDFKEVEMVVVQPRCEHPDGPVRRTTISMAELLAFGEELKKAVVRTLDPDAEFKSGKHCRFCNAKPICPKLREDNFAIAKADFANDKVLLPAPNMLTEDELVKVLEAASTISDWAKSIAEYAHERALRGDRIPGYKLVQKKGHRKWKNIEHATAQIIDALLLDVNDPEDLAKISTEPNLLSPAQIEKKLKVDKNLIASLTESPDLGTSLVKDSNKKSAIEVTSDFEAIN
ncbi:MAG: DUF2800 domain-containing protein [Flavobacterium sp.]